MQHQKISKAYVCLLSTLFLSGMANASTLGQQTLTTSTTPTALTCSSQRYVNTLTITVLPGYTGKIYVGDSSMNTSTYAHTAVILYPNGGAHSEEWTLVDKSGDDGIDLCSIYVAGGVASEHAIARYVSNGAGTSAPTYLLKLVTYGPITVSSTPTALPNLSYVREQAIPGYTYAKAVGVYSGGLNLNSYMAILMPNSGTLSKHNAWSESYEMYDPVGSNGLADNGMGTTLNTLVTNVGTGSTATSPAEAVLIAGFAKMNGATAKSPVVSWRVWNDAISFSSTGVGWNISGLNKVQARQDLFTSTKAFVADCTNSAGRVLYPTLSSGNIPTNFAEELLFTYAQFNTGSVCISAQSGLTGTVDLSYLTTFTSAGSIPAPLKTQGTPTTAQIAPPASGTSIGMGNVQRLIVSPLAGQTGKIYIGSSSMNTSTLAGVYAILYPNNSAGHWSETFELEDPEGDGIPTNSLYVKAQVSGEVALVQAVTLGVTPTHGTFSIVGSGVLSGSSSPTLLAGSSTPASFIRAQNIPGGSGKLWIGNASMSASTYSTTYANVYKVLWPSAGNYNVGEAFSETFTQSCTTGVVTSNNCLDLHSYSFLPAVSTEQLLVFALGR